MDHAKYLASAACVAAAFLVAPAASAVTIVHHDPGVGFNETFRDAGSAPMGRLTVSSSVTVSTIGVLANINGNSNLQFLIFNAVTGANLFTSAAKSFVDVGEAYYFSDPLSFTFDPGITYAVGATSSAGASYRLDEQVNTVGAFSFLLGNQNTGGAFGASTLITSQACCDVATAFVIAEPGAVPEPATWAMMLTGFGIAGAALRKRRQQTVRVTYA